MLRGEETSHTSYSSSRPSASLSTEKPDEVADRMREESGRAKADDALRGCTPRRFQRRLPGAPIALGEGDWARATGRERLGDWAEFDFDGSD